MPVWLLLILTAAGFGGSPLLLQLAVQHVPPWTLGALRAALGLPLLMIAAGALWVARPYAWSDVVTALVGGVLVVAIPFVTMAAGMQYIPSGLGGMLYATMPLFVLALAALFLRDEPVTRAQVIRIGVGLVGVVLIAGPALVAGGLAQAGLGTALTLLSPLSYAAGNVWFRRRAPLPPLLLNAGMFAVGAVLMWPAALAIDGRVAIPATGAVLGVLAAMVVLTTVAPAILNYVLVRRAGANRAALAMFLMPGFAVLFGWVFRGEQLPWLSFAGLALVVLASLPGGISRRRA
jgi:drug/metabolite transporter (DMT)-like permease